MKKQSSSRFLAKLVEIQIENEQARFCGESRFSASHLDVHFHVAMSFFSPTVSLHSHTSLVNMPLDTSAVYVNVEYISSLSCG